MRIVIGTVKSTPIQFLPVFSNIAPSHLWRRNALPKEWTKCNSNLSLPIHNFANSLQNPPRLKSRNPPWKSTIALHNTNLKKYLTGPTDKPPGHNLPRKEWTTLNRHGRCGYQMHKWNAMAIPNCECGNPYQTISHTERLTLCPIRKFNGEPEVCSTLPQKLLKGIKILILNYRRLPEYIVIFTVFIVIVMHILIVTLMSCWYSLY